MDADLPLLLFVVAMSFAAGAVNSLAGGGTFFTFPALVAAGVPALAASATSTAAVLPGYLAGAWGSQRHAQPLAGLSQGRMLAACVAGGVCGACLLLVTPRAVFAHLVPGFLLLATVLFAASPWIARLARANTASPAIASAVVFSVSTYGGYFNGGLGIMLLAALSLIGQQSLGSMNCWKARLSAVLTIISVAIYAAGDVVVWRVALPMMAGSLVGGYLGARVFDLLPKAALRWGIIASGLVCTLLFMDPT